MRSRLVTWLTSAFVLIASFASAGVTRLTGDIDGDGRTDYVTLDNREPRQLQVWLSTTAGTTILRSTTALHTVVLFDLNGDHRPELIAGSGSSSHLNIWTHTASRFGKLHPRQSNTDSRAGSTRHRFDDGPSDSTSDDQWTGRIAPQCLAQARPRAPAVARHDLILRTSRLALAHTLAAPLAPRPPPTTV